MIEPQSSFPVFVVNDVSAAKDFYTHYLGFIVAFENEWYLHLAAASGVQVGFMLPDQPTQPNVFHAHYPGRGVIFSLEVDDVDDAYSQALRHQMDIILDLRSEDWGQRHFSVRDPNGIYLDVVQAIEPTEEYQVGYADKS